jgi:Ser/Thr protein kinase RdoA (MazF antagonist)
MKLSEKEKTKIAELYNLGKIKNIKEIKEGLINYNFIFTTEKGEFIIRILGPSFKKYSSSKKRIKLEFKVLRYLKKEKFPYKTPLPIKNKQSKYLSKINKNDLWVYRKLEGNYIKRLSNKNLKEIARALGHYHKFIRKLDINKIIREIGFKTYKKLSGFGWLAEKYSHIKRIKPKNKTDKLMLKNIDFFDSCLKTIMKLKLNKNIIITHSDFKGDNLLFRKNKLVTILDFGSIDINPQIKDVADAIKDCCFIEERLDKRKLNLFLKEYEKMNLLIKEEKEMLIPLIIGNNCFDFWAFYEGTKEKLNKRYFLLKRIVDTTKKLVREVE